MDAGVLATVFVGMSVICLALFFSGIIYGGFKNENKPAIAAGLVGLLFVLGPVFILAFLL